MRKTIQFILGLILSLLGVPSESNLFKMVAKKILCEPKLNEIVNICDIYNIVAWLFFIIGIIMILELILEWTNILNFSN